MEKIVLFGLGEIAELAHFYLSNDTRYEVVAFCVDADFITKKIFKNLPVVAFEEIEKLYPPTTFKMFIPLGYTKVNKLREEKFLKAKEIGYKFISYISPNARVASNVTIDENCFIFEDNNIQPFVEIKENTILWSGNHIGHHSTIEKNCFIASHVVISGGVTIGKNTFIGVNATIRDKIKIADFNVIGAGALILSDTKEKQVFIAKESKASKVPSNRLRGI